MVFDGRWKFIWVEGHRPMLYDLETDPEEVVDLGDSKKHQTQIERMREMMFNWARQQHTRVAISDAQIETGLFRSARPISQLACAAASPN